MFVNIGGLRVETCFNVPVYQEVQKAQYEIEKKIKIRDNLTTLSRLELDVPILNATQIEYTLVHLARAASLSNDSEQQCQKVICLWILRQWQIVRKERKVGMTQNIRRTLTPGRILPKITVQKKNSILMSEKYVKDKRYLAKYKKETSTTLFGLCKAQIQGRLKETLKRKNNDFLLPLVSKISCEALSRAEEQVPTLQEFSAILWQLLIRRDFSSIRHPVLMTCPKEIYFYGLQMKNLLLPMVEETNIPFLMRSLSEPSPSSRRIIRKKLRSSEVPSSFKPNVIEDTQQASTSSESTEVPEDPFSQETPEDVQIASTSVASVEDSAESPEDPLVPDGLNDLSDVEIAEEAEEEQEVEDEDDDNNTPEIGDCLRVVFVKIGVYVASIFVICAAIASL